MDTNFTSEVKGLVCDVSLICRKNPVYIQTSRARRSNESGMHLNLKNIDRLLQSGTIDEKTRHQLLKYKENCLNRIEKQEALLESARASFMSDFADARRTNVQEKEEGVAADSTKKIHPSNCYSELDTDMICELLNNHAES